MSTDQKKASNPLAGLASLVFLGFIAYQAYSCNQVGSGSHVSDTDRAQPLYRISAQQLFTMYDQNEVAADAELKGKTVVVTGTVRSIDKNIAESPVIRLDTSNDFDPVSLELVAGQEQAAAALIKGQEVTISCAAMERIVESPMGSRCVINSQ